MTDFYDVPVGLVTLGTAFVKTYGQLLAVRFLLGFCEGGYQAGKPPSLHTVVNLLLGRC